MDLQLVVQKVEVPEGYLSNGNGMATHEKSEIQAKAAEIVSSEVNSSEDLIDAQVTYPEGGLQAWLVVFGSFCGVLGAFGFMNSLGVFQEYISTHQLSTYSPSSIGWIFSIYMFLAFGCGLVVGPIFDAKGPSLLLTIGGLCLVAGCVLLASSTKYWSICLSIALTGVGNSLIFTPCFTSVGHFFLRRRGIATGMATTGGSVGGIIFPFVLQKLFRSLGFAWGTRALALVMLVLSSIAILLVRTRLPPKPGQSMLPNLFILKDSAFALTTVGVFFNEWALAIPITYIASFIVNATDISPDSTSTLPFALIASLNAGSTIGRVLPAFISDRFGRFNLMIFTLIICVFAIFGLWLPASALPVGSAAIKPLTILFVVLFGFGSGGNITLAPVCVGQLCDTEEYGRYYSTCYTVVSIGCLTGIPIAGALIEAGNDRYVGAVAFTGASYVVSWWAFQVARHIKVGWTSAIY